MLAPDILNKLGFTKLQKNEYNLYEGCFGDAIEGIAERYEDEEISYGEALRKARELECDGISEYTLELMFVLHCTGFLKIKYAKKEISDDIFYDSMMDIRYKIDECLKVKNVLGTFVADWFEGFFTLDRFKLGRLEYDITKHKGESVAIHGVEVKDGDFIMNCHIPSSGPLYYEDVLESYKKAYSFSKNMRSSKVLPIKCESWFLYPPYEEPFKASPHITRFNEDYTVYKVVEEDKFNDAWRVFSCGADDVDSLKEDTSLRRSFKKYIKEVGTYGHAYGMFLFDGSEIIK